MTVPPRVPSFVDGVRRSRQARGDGTLGGRVRSATPSGDRPVGGRQQAATAAVGPSTLVDTLTLTANSQQIATTTDDVVWHNELVGLTPRAGFADYGGTPTSTVTMPVDGRLFTNLTLLRSTATAWTVRWHVTRGSDTFTFDMPAGSSTDPAIAEAPPLTVKAGDVLRVRIIQSSGGDETLDGATLHLSLIHVTPRSEPPPEGCRLDGTATLMFSSPSTNPQGLAWDGTDLWHADRSSDTIYRLDITNGSVLQSFASPGGGPNGLAWDGTDLWNADNLTDTIYRLNPADGSVLQSFASPDINPSGLTWDGTHLWHANQGSAVIYRLDPADGTVLQQFAAPGSSPLDLAWDGTHLWHVDDMADTVYRLDPADGTVLQQFASPSGSPSGLTWDTTHGCRLWHCDYSTDSIYTIE